MNLNDYVDALTTDSYRGIYLDDSGAVAEERIPQVINAANAALERIYADTQYRKRQVRIMLSRDISHYPLEPKYSMSTPGTGVTEPFIIDTVDEPFSDRVGNIIAVSDIHGTKRPLNSSNVSHPVMVTDARVLYVPRRKHLELLEVTYSIAPNKITRENMHEDIILDLALEPALQAYMGYYLFRGTATESAALMSSTFLNEYNGIMGQISDRNVINTSESVDTLNFRKNGWV